MVRIRSYSTSANGLRVYDWTTCADISSSVPNWTGRKVARVTAWVDVCKDGNNGYCYAIGTNDPSNEADALADLAALIVQASVDVRSGNI